MTKEEIQALIDAKIAGQGTMVDVGGALPTILKEIVDLALAGANVQSDWNQADNTKADFIKNKPTIPASAPVFEVAEFSGAKDITGDERELLNNCVAVKVGDSFYLRNDLVLSNNTLKTAFLSTVNGFYYNLSRVNSIFAQITLFDDGSVALANAVLVCTGQTVDQSSDYKLVRCFYED